MKKIKLKSATAALQDKKLSEEQMNDLLGGLKCPYCGYDFEPSDVKGSNYLCIGLDMNANRKEVTVWAFSVEEAVTKAENKGVLVPICYPGEYYNTAPGF